MRSVWIAVLLGIVLASGGLSASTAVRAAGAGKAVVIGGIDPCEGRPVPHAARYAAGTVTVRAGEVRERRMAHGQRLLLPPHVVARVHVARNKTYRLVLKPGHYIFEASFPPPANVHPFFQITLKAGELIHRDIPNMCT